MCYGLIIGGGGGVGEIGVGDVGGGDGVVKKVGLGVWGGKVRVGMKEVREVREGVKEAGEVDR